MNKRKKRAATKSKERNKKKRKCTQFIYFVFRLFCVGCVSFRRFFFFHFARMLLKIINLTQHNKIWGEIEWKKKTNTHHQQQRIEKNCQAACIYRERKKNVNKTFATKKRSVDPSTTAQHDTETIWKKKKNKIAKKNIFFLLIFISVGLSLSSMCTFLSWLFHTIHLRFTFLFCNLLQRAFVCFQLIVSAPRHVLGYLCLLKTGNFLAFPIQTHILPMLFSLGWRFLFFFLVSLFISFHFETTTANHLAML